MVQTPYQEIDPIDFVIQDRVAIQVHEAKLLNVTKVNDLNQNGSFVTRHETRRADKVEGPGL